MRKHHKALAAKALMLGWEFAGFTKGHHLRFRGPHGDTIITGSSPSDHRAEKNALALMRRKNKENESNGRS